MYRLTYVVGCSDLFGKKCPRRSMKEKPAINKDNEQASKVPNQGHAESQPPPSPSSGKADDCLFKEPLPPKRRRHWTPVGGSSSNDLEIQIRRSARLNPATVYPATKVPKKETQTQG